jgi:hypothetical protein
LETLKRSLGARGDARGALAIQEEIDRVRESGANSEGVARFAGVWRIISPDHGPQIYTIKADGAMTWTEDPPVSAQKHPGKITIVGKDYLLEFDDHLSITRLSLAGDKLMLEVWVPKTTYPAAAPGRASGVRVERRP